jgi:dihydroflavonol-4-reductase
VTALVTGGTGFVGFHVARLLVERGTPVKALARASSKKDNLLQLDPGLLTIVDGDLRNPDSLARAMEGCDTLYHVAADYRLWSANPQELYDSNVGGTRFILEAARTAGIQRTVYTSTVGALGIPRDGSPGNETTHVTEADMIGHYKRSKFLAEQEALKFALSGMHVVIVNPSTPVGENDIKPTPTGKIIVDFLNGKLPAYLNTGLNLVDVRDVAAGMLLAAERGVSGQKYILGCQNTSMKEMLEMLAAITGRRAPAIQMPYGVAYTFVGLENLAAGILKREPAHPFEGVKMAKHHMYFDASRAVNELGLPQSSVKEALARAVEWFQTHGMAR